MLSVSQAASSPAVSLVYSVRNGTVFLNGTIASNLLGQLSAELVGYFLFYPPLVIAERKLQFASPKKKIARKTRLIQRRLTNSKPKVIIVIRWEEICSPYVGEGEECFMPTGESIEVSYTILRVIPLCLVLRAKL